MLGLICLDIEQGSEYAYVSLQKKTQDCKHNMDCLNPCIEKTLVFLFEQASYGMFSHKRRESLTVTRLV